MKRNDVIGWLLILLWLSLSAYFAVIGHGDMFQRVGTVGISAAVIYFALQYHATPYPHGLLDRLHWMDQQTEQAQHAAMVANARNAVLAKAILATNLDKSVGFLDPVGQLANVPNSDIEAGLAGRTERSAEVRRELLHQQQKANQMVNGVHRAASTYQTICVVLGTIQTGFGSLLFSESCTGILTC